MKQSVIKSIVILGSIFSLWSCGTKEVKVDVVSSGGEELYVCDISKVKDSLDIPLSKLVESIHIVKLDTAKDALFGWGSMTMTDNYIGVASSQQPYKLFDKNGKFIRNIGAVGKGPGEYLNIYCSQIDEKDGRVYLMPWQTKVLLPYTLEGEALPPIQMAGILPKGTFQVEEGVITAFALPLPGTSCFAWQEDLEGNIKDTIPAAPYVEPDNYYSNEILSSFNADRPDVYVFRWSPRQDTLYHYKEGRLIPRFTVVFPGGKVPMHEYAELPGHYFVSIMEFDGRNSTTNYQKLYVDKKTKNVTWGKIKDDLFLEGEEVWSYNFKNGKYMQSYPAVTLIEKLEKMLKRSDLSPELRKQAEDLLKNLDENDNNIIVWGNLKS